jgi:hypothetical protein
MCTEPDSVSLSYPTGEHIVEFFRDGDPELMYEQSACVRGRSADPWVTDAALQVEVAVENMQLRLGSGKPTPAAFDRDGSLAHRVRKRSARGDQVHEGSVEDQDLRRLTQEMSFYRPLIETHELRLWVRETSTTG